MRSTKMDGIVHCDVIIEFAAIITYYAQSAGLTRAIARSVNKTLEKFVERKKKIRNLISVVQRRSGSLHYSSSATNY